jgi:subtilisin family serine protease
MASRRNGAYCAVQQSALGLVASGRWEVLIRGRANRYDLWVSGSSLPTSVNVRGELDADDHLTIPATNEDILSVASFTTKRTWTSFFGRYVQRVVTVGMPSGFSSTGPTADGRFKPDLAAPGEFITSTLSADALPTQNASAFHTTLRTLWADDGVHGVLRGTSMACPHVVGAVALILQKRPELDAPAVKELLRATARTDDFVGPGAVWSPKWGFGKLAVDIFARVLAGEQPERVDVNVSAVGVSRDVVPPNAGADSISVITVVPKDASGLPLGKGHQVEIETTAGHFDGDALEVSDFGRWERRLVSNSLGKVARITVRVDGVELARHPTISFVDSRTEVGAPFDQGCAQVMHGSPRGTWLLLLLLVLRRGRGSRARSFRPPRAY